MAVDDPDIRIDAARTLDAHAPIPGPPDLPRQPPIAVCLSCGERWPCPPYTEAQVGAFRD